MLLQRKLRCLLAFVFSVAAPLHQLNANGLVVARSGPRLAAKPSIAARQPDGLVRLRLVEDLKKPGSSVSVRLAAGATGIFNIDVKRSALSAGVLAAAFAARSSVAAMRLKRPNSNIVIYIPDTSSFRPLSPENRLKFEHLVKRLQDANIGEVIEVSGS